MINCEWIGISNSVLNEKDEKKSGRYTSSVYPITGYGINKWAVHGYLKVNWQQHLEEGKSKKEIIDGCIEFLNQPPERKKYQKKEPKPKFGNLQPVSADWTDSGYEANFKEDKLIVTLLTDERKNKSFWGEGYNLMPSGKTPKKRGRKKKEKK